MFYLFFFAAIAFVIALGVNLSEINPFRAKPLSMLDQIEEYLSRHAVEKEELENVRLAA